MQLIVKMVRLPLHGYRNRSNNLNINGLPGITDHIPVRGHIQDQWI